MSPELSERWSDALHRSATSCRAVSYRAAPDRPLPGNLRVARFALQFGRAARSSLRLAARSLMMSRGWQDFTCHLTERRTDQDFALPQNTRAAAERRSRLLLLALAFALTLPLACTNQQPRSGLQHYDRTFPRLDLDDSSPHSPGARADAYPLAQLGRPSRSPTPTSSRHPSLDIPSQRPSPRF